MESLAWGDRLYNCEDVWTQIKQMIQLRVTEDRKGNKAEKSMWMCVRQVQGHALAETSEDTPEADADLNRSQEEDTASSLLRSDVAWSKHS